MKNATLRCVIVAIGLAVQILFFLVFYIYLGKYVILLNVIYQVLGFFIVLFLIKNSKSLAFTLPWIVIILLIPLIGPLLYVIIGRNKRKSKLLKRIIESEKNIPKYLKQDSNVREEYKDNGRLKYISDFANYPVSNNNDVEYYPLGEIAFKEIVKELKKAKDFIFIEYFIIAPGKMWDEILEILKEKAKNGVDVRVMYDDMGSIATLESSYPKKLKKYGIKCQVFNVLSPLSGIIMNNRDHRKILVIDGKVAFSGGINLADEYINETVRFGHWKDNATKVIGDSVYNYTIMFLTMWNALVKEDNDFSKYKYEFKETTNKGFVSAYGETPLDDEIVGQNIYLNIINQAKDYVYITTPYLIVDTDMINALTLASQRGVDVRIVIPGIPDKKLVYSLSESYVEPLVKKGVKVYKYSPGFIHSKVFVSDDYISTVGTINLDYRSLYLHFECGLYMENTKCIKDIKLDMLDTISKSKLLKEKDIKPGFFKAMVQSLLRLIAPLL